MSTLGAETGEKNAVVGAHIAEALGRVAVAIVNYRRPEDTIRAITSLGASTYSNWRAIVIDNAPTEEHCLLLTKALSEHIVFASPENLGFAGGCNKAIEIAKQEGFDHVFMLNNDAVADANTLKALVTASASLGHAALLGSAVLYADTQEFQFIGARRDRFGEPLRLAAPADLKAGDMIKTDFILGAAFFAPINVLSKVGTFDNRFFLNYEEADLCFRAQALGVAQYVVSDSVVHHASSSTMGDEDGPLQSFFLWRNELLFLEKNATALERFRSYKRRGKWLIKKIATEIIAGEGLSLSTRAKLMGIRDFMLRRFGDCPPRIRTYAQCYNTGERLAHVSGAYPDDSSTDTQNRT